MSIEAGISDYVDRHDSSEAKKLFSQLIRPGQYVGELYSINYETARVLINDHERHIVNGIPSLCFLLATRVDPSSDDIDFKNEESSAIILRVLDSANSAHEKTKPKKLPYLLVQPLYNMSEKNTSQNIWSLSACCIGSHRKPCGAESLSLPD